MTKQREAELERAFDNWRKHCLVLRYAGAVAVPRNELEETFAKLQKQVDAENAASARRAIDAAC